MTLELIKQNAKNESDFDLDTDDFHVEEIKKTMIQVFSYCLKKSGKIWSTYFTVLFLLLSLLILFPNHKKKEITKVWILQK